MDAGVRTIIIVTGEKNLGDSPRLLSNAEDFDLFCLHNTYQEGEGGIADALCLA
ncbi:MAG: hypothetical protein WA639_20975 [Candidatus Acidiferrum sp.]